MLILLIGLHALITLAYAALKNSRQVRLREQAETDEDAPPRLRNAYKLGLLLLRFTIAALAVTQFGESLITSLSIADAETEQAVAYIMVLLPTALITLILGDLVPEAIGSTRADAIAPWAAYPMHLLSIILAPLVWLMLGMSKSIAAFFGSGRMVNIVTEEEIMTMLDASEKEGGIENEEKEMIVSVLEFGDLLVREVMVPRIDIVAVEIDTPVLEALKVFVKSGHSRVPVYEDNIDNIKGLLYAKDLLNLWSNGGADRPISEIMRTATFVPESKRADVLLKELQSGKIHIVIIVDEYGGTAGLITLEDLIEEIVGDIQDEYDMNEEAEYVKNGPDNFTVDASINLDDLNDLLDAELPNEDADTLGGFLFSYFGRVPVIGETVEHQNLTMKIETIQGRRIRKVRITRKPVLTASGGDLREDAKSTPRPQPVTD